ncbi:MAG: hypothetical protein HYY04_18635, partial [Chloroflexi bacterium]|nr:hypothetical protein [Chloroflexota bacterium]
MDPAVGLSGIGILDHVEQVAVEGLTWVDVQQPIPSEIGRLSETFPVDPLDLQVALQPHSRQPVVGREGYAIVRLDVPAASRRTRALETV